MDATGKIVILFLVIAALLVWIVYLASRLDNTKAEVRNLKRDKEYLERRVKLLKEDADRAGDYEKTHRMRSAKMYDLFTEFFRRADKVLKGEQ